MANLNLSHIYKVYPGGVKAVNDFCMDIADKEFIVFVGPSGCGKSTTLRMIAGLEEITAGELKIGDAVVNDMEPKDRDIAMVFQNYALYPHMSVYNNMAFGLKIRKIPDIKKDENGNPVLDKNGKEIKVMRHYTKEEIDARVKGAANILGISEYLDRKPKSMSGGQRQRVALGRAIVREPKVFLLDEPLSNLDAKLRTTMRAEIAKLHRRLQTTFIYVTHDQVEAMTMGTRIVVMKDGFIQQIDSPRNLYNFPCNKFVAGFIGTPQMNFYSGKLKLKGDKVKVTFDDTDVEIDAPYEYFVKVNKCYLDGEKRVIIGLRAEHISTDPEQYLFAAKCKVSNAEELGTDCQLYADFNLNSDENVAESPTRVIAKAPAGSLFSPEGVITLSLDLSKIHLFDAETEQSICPQIPKSAQVSCNVSGGELRFLGATVTLAPAIKVDDGEYTLNIPIEAISLGGETEGSYVDEEIIDGKRLIRVSLGGESIFVLDAADGKRFAKGAKIKLAFDEKMVTITRNGEIVAAALPSQNSLLGGISTRKVVSIVDGKKVKEHIFELRCGGYVFPCSKHLGLRIVAGGGQSIFNKPIELAFSPRRATLAENGISAVVEKVLDYGDEKFAVCRVGERRVVVSCCDVVEGSEVKIALNAEELSVVEPERGIRLI